MSENKIVINNKKVEQLRKLSGISQKRLGDEIGVSQSGVNNLEKGYPLTDGTKQNLRLDSFCRLARYFGVSMEYLIDEVEDRRQVKDLLAALDATPKTDEPIEEQQDDLLVFLQNPTMRKFVESLMMLTEIERGMMILLAQRLADTQAQGTPEAREVANMIDSMPEAERVEALSEFKQFRERKANEHNSVLEKRIDYLLGFIRDSTGQDIRDQVEKLFRIEFDACEK